MFNDTPEATTQFCNECEYIGWHGEGTPTGKHSCGIDFTASDKPLEPVEDDFVEGAIKSLARDTHGLQLWVKNPYKTEAYLLHPNFFREFFTDLLHHHKTHVREKVGEEIKTDYRENATNEEKMSFASGQTLARVISLITKK